MGSKKRWHYAQSGKRPGERQPFPRTDGKRRTENSDLIENGATRTVGWKPNTKRPGRKLQGGPHETEKDRPK